MNATDLARLLNCKTKDENTKQDSELLLIFVYMSFLYAFINEYNVCSFQIS